MSIQPGDIVVVSWEGMDEKFSPESCRTALVVSTAFQGRLFVRWISDGVEEYLPVNPNIEKHWRQDVSPQDQTT